MNILYVLNSGKPGGMEKHVLDLVSGMVSLDHSVFVWCADGEIVEWYKKAGAAVFIQPLNFICDIPYIYRLTSFLKANKIDVVHANELKVVANVGVAAFFAKTRVKISHTHTPVSEWKISQIAKMLNVFVYARIVNWLFDKEIALTNSRKAVKISEGINPNKLEIIPNGINTEKFELTSDAKSSYRLSVMQRFAIPENAFIFGYIGRMTVEKGHEILINAFAQFLKMKNTENVYLLLAGGGPLENSLKVLAQKLAISDKVLITGVYPQQNLEKYLFSMDAFVFPSLAEGFGIVLLEAMAAGLPTICSDLEVLQEVGGSTVFYFETGNAENLAMKMHDLYSKRDSISNMSPLVKNRVKELFNITDVVASYAKLYNLINSR